MEKDLEFFMNQNYRVSLYHDPDGYWVAEHPELPGCIADGETAQEALSSLDVSRELWIESRLAAGLEVPPPQGEPQYSGKFVLRIAKGMHRELAKEAEAEGVSLNSHISSVLASRNARSGQPATTRQDFQDLLRATACTQGDPAISTEKSLWGMTNSPINLTTIHGAASLYQNPHSLPQPLQIIAGTKHPAYEDYEGKEFHVA
jgi:predicted RNase H-like HicB family nuclease